MRRSLPVRAGTLSATFVLAAAGTALTAPLSDDAGAAPGSEDPTDEAIAPWEAAESGDLEVAEPELTPPPVARSTRERVEITTMADTAIAPGLTLTEFSGSGPVRGAILEADLTEATLEPTYLSAGSVASTSVLTSQLERVGAIAGVNGDFFDIGVTGAPRGVGIDDGQLVNAPASGWNESVALSPAGAGYVAQLDQVSLDGTIELPGGDVALTNLNSPNIADGGIGVYTSAWGSAGRGNVVDGAGRVRELEVADGTVTRVATSAGSGAVADGSQIVLGRDAGADALADIEVGDEVTVSYTANHEPDDVDVAISGNVVLVDDGEVVAPDHPRHPRTAVGLDADGTTMWLVTVDGRSSASVGMTYVELANFMTSIGAVDALNLDGGGSTTMVARVGDQNTVVNNPSDGSQRSVPNGLGFASTAACPLVNRTFAAYPALEPGSAGPEVRAAQCQLVDAGFRPTDADPDGDFTGEVADQVAAFQADRGLPDTGAIDAHTWTALLSIGDTPTLRDGSSGMAVSRLQRSLTAALERTVGVDGLFGPRTEEAVRDYQSSRGLDVDGIAGPQTWGALQAGS